MNPEAVSRIVRARDTKSRTLDLSDLELEEFPPQLGELGELGELEVLDLSGNRLAQLPDWFASLGRLRVLDLSRNQLDLLPTCLRSLTELQRVWLYDNPISDLPEWVAGWNRLEYIGLGTSISLPGGLLGLLKQLQGLGVNAAAFPAFSTALLEGAQLSWLCLQGSLPAGMLESLRSLSSLNSLLLRDAGTLPESVGQLTQLQQLDVSDNQLTALPKSVGQLTQLRQFHVSDNQLTALPESVGQLTQLQQLDVSRNELKALPESVGQLTQLQQFDASGNGLTALPESIGDLYALKHLDLYKNKLTSLPPQLLKLKLDALWLQENPALELSVSVTGEYPEVAYKRFSEPPPRDALSILKVYFAARSADAQPLNEVKLVLVGRGSAGKTSIARRLVKDSFARAQRETQGIDIARWKLQCGEREVRVNIWDFAGQVVTHATHQFFLSESSVYVLVLTGREDTQRLDADYWLKLIHAFAADRDGQVAPVIVALNKFEAHPFKIDRLALKERYPFIVDFVETDCRSGLGIGALKANLASTIDAMPLVRQGFKRQWWQVKRALEAAQRKKNYLPYSDFQAMCARHGVRDAAGQRFLADVFHALGVALNYGRDPRLRDATVLNPRWLTEGIYKLLREAAADDGSAVLSMDAVRAALPDEPEAMQRYLVTMMMRFDLAFPLNEGNDLWLVPQRLPAEQPELTPYLDAARDSTRMRFVYPVVHEGLVPRFIARTYPLSEQPGGKALPRWANGVVLHQGDAQALVRMDLEERRIDIVVSGEREARLELLGVVQADFRTIHRDIKGLGEREELEVEGQAGIYVDVRTLRADERTRRPSSASTPDGTVPLDATVQLNRLSEPAARDESVRRARVFISYTSANARLKDELLIRLKPLKETHGLLDTWDDRCIPPRWRLGWRNPVRTGERRCGTAAGEREIPRV
jgi:internalin A